MFNQIQFNLLTVSPENVRIFSSDKKADKELKAMILKMGVLQNLVVHPLVDGKHGVVAGGRRFTAIKELVEENIFPSDYMIPVREVPLDADATAISLAENMGRASMNPADEYTAFAKMVDRGASIEDVSLTFGVTKKLVKQRMKLGNVATAILNKFRDGGMSLDSLMAFTVTDDKNLQLECLKEFEEGGMWSHNIKRFLLNDAVTSKNKLVKFVGKSAYTKAGGATSTDLFDDNCYFLNSNLLHSLATDKLLRFASDIRKSKQWLWVEIATCEEDRTKILKNVSQLYPSLHNVPKTMVDKQNTLTSLIDSAADPVEEDKAVKELSALNNKIDTKYLKLTQKQKSYSGVLLYVGYSGELEVSEGLAKDADVYKFESSSDSNVTTMISDSEDKKEKISQSLSDDLGQYRQQITQATLLKSKDLALDVLYYTLCKNILSMGQYNNLIDASFRKVYSDTSREDTNAGRAFDEIEAARMSLNTQWLDSDNKDKRFKMFQSLATEDKSKLVTYCISQMLTVKVKGLNSDQDSLIDQLGVPFSEYWKPTKDNYFKRVTKNKLLLEFEDELQGLPTDAKKATCVEFLNQWTDSEGETKRPWIPEQF